MKLWNPSKKDFECIYDGKPLKIARSLEFTDYEGHEYNHVRKHLITFIINDRGIKSTDALAVQKITQEVTNV